jgi:fermentation-respiration switch protein FrsA (DUF1100 family)
VIHGRSGRVTEHNRPEPSQRSARSLLKSKYSDPRCVILPTELAADPRTSSTSIFQFRWVVGAPDNETALEWAKKFTLEGVAQRIECAFLVLHGENDRIVPLAEAKTLYERVGSRRKHIKIFTAEDGGAEHCQVDHRQLGVDYIGDWLLANM